MKTAKVSRRRNTQAVIALMASLLSIAVGLLVGLALLTILNAPFALSGFGKILTTGVASTEKLAKTLYQAMPMMLCGLSVAFAFKTGLFNIGAAGQYTMGRVLRAGGCHRAAAAVAYRAAFRHRRRRGDRRRAGHLQGAVQRQ